MQYVIDIVCVNQLFMLSVRLSAYNRLFVVVFGESKVTCRFSTAQGFGTPNPSIVQGSTVLGILLSNLFAVFSFLQC